MDTLSVLADNLLSRLAWTALQATVLIAVLWLIMRCVPRLSPAMRCMLWWLVAAQLVLGLVISTPVQLHWLKPDPVAMAATNTVVMHVHSDNTIAPAQTVASASPVMAPGWSWTEAVMLLWFSVVVLHGLFAVRHWLDNRALLRGARPAAHAALQALCTQQAHALGMRRAPLLLTSEAIVSPQVTGLWRPVVLLPAEQTLSCEELSMAIAHELAHIHRGDLWLGWLPAVAQRLFFFHPLVTWAVREYAVYREAACDAQVLQRHDAAPHRYGHLLVRLGVVDPMHSSLAGASSTFLHLKRRLIMLQQSVNDTTPRMRGWVLVAAIALIGVLPYRVTASTAQQSDAAAPSVDSMSAPPAPMSPPVPETPATPAIPPTPATPAVPPTPETPATPPVPPTPQTPATPPVPPTPQTPAAPPLPPAPPAPSAAEHNMGFSARYMDINTHANATRGVLLYDGDVVIFDGSEHDLADAQRLRKPGGPMLWFRQGNRAYVSRDPDLIRQARDAYAPLSDMARAQSDVAYKSSELAAQQGALAARQGALAAREAEFSSQRASLESQRAALRAVASQENFAHSEVLKGQVAGTEMAQAEIKREEQALQRAIEALSKQEAELSARHATASATQIAAEANQHLNKLLDEAVTRGVANPVNR